MEKIARALIEARFMTQAGAYCVVDGQYGSTGKGLLGAVLAEASLTNSVLAVDTSSSNAGPNSGHTFYHEGEKVVLRQLPSFATFLAKSDFNQHIHINAGAILVPEILIEEIHKHIPDECTVTISELAAVVTSEAVEQEKSLVGQLGSTGKGTGAALANKVMRREGAIIRDVRDNYKWPDNVFFWDVDMNGGIDMHDSKVMVEVSQGFSLSLNAANFYPYCTSRDCTVAQGLSDAQVHPSMYAGAAMVVRTHPIRVAGNSGPCYSDQVELSWEELGFQPEFTTVTGKQRRIFSWSKKQYAEALKVNRPDVVFSNFMNYLGDHVDHREWVETHIRRPYLEIMGQEPVILLGYGPLNSDVELYK